MKKGFTLTEVLMSMAIIGLVSALSIPLISRSLASQHKQAYKAAFNDVNQVVNELINDTTLCPTGEFINRDDLCNKFYDKVNAIGTNKCNVSSSIPNTPNIVTLNGMRWYFSRQGITFGAGCPDTGTVNCLRIYVDVNGNKGKNKDSGANAERDILSIYISKTGKVYTPPTGQGPERSYITD